MSKKSIRPMDTAVPASDSEPAVAELSPTDATTLDSATLLAITLDGTVLINTNALPGLGINQLKGRKLFVGAELKRPERLILRSHVDEASVELCARILGALIRRRRRAPKAKRGSQ
jgi:hypothetical protein